MDKRTNRCTNKIIFNSFVFLLSISILFFLIFGNFIEFQISIGVAFHLNKDERQIIHFLFFLFKFWKVMEAIGNLKSNAKYLHDLPPETEIPNLYATDR